MPELLHSIKAWLYSNLLTKDPDNYTARTSSEASLDVGKICNSAVKRGSTPTTVAAMELNTNLFLKEMAYLLCNGYSVNTGYFTANVLIKGVFNNTIEKFDSDKHTVVFQFNQGELLRKELANVSVEIMGAADSNLFIAEVTDVKTDTTNDLLTPNRNLKISGYKLKIVGNKPETGVYFINQITYESIKVDDSDIVTNNPSELIIVIPELPAGTYKVKVSSQYSGNSIKWLKEASTSVFDKILTVE